MVCSDPAGAGWDIHALFCHYNALYFSDSLGACAVSWAVSPLPQCFISTCDYYPGGGCDILLSKSLCECQTNSDLKNALLHEMIHAYMCINDNNTNHSSDHGAKFQHMMNSINFSSVADPHRPVGGYNITTLHEITKKFHHYKCESCGDLIKSTKIRGPSHDDCILKMVADNLCQNSMCHWHSHKKLCSGSYHRVQELSPGCTEAENSKAEEAPDMGKAKEPAYESWHTSPKSNKCGTSNKHDSEDAFAEFLHPVDEAIDSSGLHSSMRTNSNKKAKLSKDIFDVQTAATVQETPKRPRTTAPKSEECGRQKKRKLTKYDGGYSVIIEWLNFFCVDEVDENEPPLINKRTERRKRQKLLKISQDRESNNGVESANSTSHIENGRKDGNDKSENVVASQVTESMLPNCYVNSHGVAGNHAAHQDVLSPLDSPVRGEIVDISDG